MVLQYFITVRWSSHLIVRRSSNLRIYNVRCPYGMMNDDGLTVFYNCQMIITSYCQTIVRRSTNLTIYNVKCHNGIICQKWWWSYSILWLSDDPHIIRLLSDDPQILQSYNVRSDCLSWCHMSYDICLVQDFQNHPTSVTS